MDNGLEVVLQVDRAAPLVAVVSSVAVGQRHDPKGHAGLAHYTEHLLFRGTDEDSGVLSQYRKLGAIGLNGHTTPDRTEYYAIVPTNQLERALWIEARRFAVGLSRVTEQQAEDEAEVVRREFALRSRSEGRATAGVLNGALYTEEHPYHDLQSNEQTLEVLDLPSARWFHEQLYSMDRTRLVLVGDFEVDQVKRLVEKHWSKLRAKPPPPPRGVQGRPDLVHTLEPAGEACRYRTEGWAPPPKELKVRVPYKLPGFHVVWPVPAGQRPEDLLKVLRLWSGEAEIAAREAQLASRAGSYEAEQDLASFVGLYFTLNVDKDYRDVEKLVWQHYEEFLASAQSSRDWKAMAQTVELAEVALRPDLLRRGFRLAERPCEALSCESEGSLTQEKAAELAELLSKDKALVITSEFDFGTVRSGPQAEVVK